MMGLVPAFVACRENSISAATDIVSHTAKTFSPTRFASSISFSTGRVLSPMLKGEPASFFEVHS